MGTETYVTIEAVITGQLVFDHADRIRLPDVARKELEFVCSKYGLELKWEER